MKYKLQTSAITHFWQICESSNSKKQMPFQFVIVYSWSYSQFDYDSCQCKFKNIQIIFDILD